MAFFNDLIETMEKSPPDRVPPVPGATSTVLMYAPRRLRADRPDALQKAEGEIAYWRARACRAEARLMTLEARIRRIAAAVRPVA